MEESQSLAAVLRDVLAEDRTLLGRRAELLAALDARADDVDFLAYSAFQQAVHDSTVGERLLAADALDDTARMAVCDEARTELRDLGMQERAIGSVVETIVMALGWHEQKDTAQADTAGGGDMTGRKSEPPDASKEAADAPADVAIVPDIVEEPATALPAVPASGPWTCICGHTGNKGRFCTACGRSREDGDLCTHASLIWACTCGKRTNKGNFCTACGRSRAEGEVALWTCSCGHAGNAGAFCVQCGKHRP